jgi:hypothetical protein
MNTFFGCICTTLKLEYAPLELREAALRLFENIMFVDKSKRSMLNVRFPMHPATQAWTAKCARVNKKLHSNANDWLRAYTHATIIRMAVEFLEYHRPDNRPKRLFCRLVFAHLVANILQIKIGLTKERQENSIKWIYPIESEESITIDSQQIILVFVPRCGGFYVPRNDVPCPLILEMESVQEESGYSLRCYNQVDQTNRHVARFQNVGAETYTVMFTPQVGLVYQVYPGNEKRTFFSFPHGTALFAYRLHTDGAKFTRLAYSAATDQYLYFELTPVETTIGVCVVCARSEQEALDKVKLL